MAREGIQRAKGGTAILVEARESKHTRTLFIYTPRPFSAYLRSSHIFPLQRTWQDPKSKRSLLGHLQDSCVRD